MLIICGLRHLGGSCKTSEILYESILTIKHPWSVECIERTQAESDMTKRLDNEAKYIFPKKLNLSDVPLDQFNLLWENNMYEKQSALVFESSDFCVQNLKKDTVLKVLSILAEKNCLLLIELNIRGTFLLSNQKIRYLSFKFALHCVYVHVTYTLYLQSLQLFCCNKETSCSPPFSAFLCR